MGNGDVGHQRQHSIPASGRGQDLLGTGAMHQLEGETHGYFLVMHLQMSFAAHFAPSWSWEYDGIMRVQGVVCFRPIFSHSRQAGFK